MNTSTFSSVAKSFGCLSGSILLSLSLAACGGGGGSAGSTGTAGAGGTSGTTPTPTPTPTTTTPVVSGAVTLSLVDSKGVASQSLTNANPLTAKATITDATGTPVANTVVTFATGGTLSVLSPASGAVLTNASGVASVTLAPKDLATAQTQSGAADTVTATATVGTQPLSAKQNFNLGNTAVTLSLASSAAVSLNSYATTAIKVNVLANGVLYTAQPVTVNFTSGCAGTGQATLAATATTVNGQAQVVYADKGCGGTDVVSISTAGAPAVTSTLTIAPPVAASISFVSATPSDKAIVLKGSGGNGRVETATLKFLALDSSGKPLPNQLIDFTVNPLNVVNLLTTQATTGADGTVLVTVNSGTTPTTFRVIATYDSTPSISTISDSVLVTTGQPIQAAFSLSATTLNIAGWDHDNVTTDVNILLADNNGNPVADGTPVLFTTDSGSIGSASSGGCNTVNGGCSVKFRSQNPRFGMGTTPALSPAGKAGIATVAVSTTSALYSLNGSIGIVLSMDNPVVPAGTTALSTTSCAPYSLQLKPIDGNGNPLPAGTTIASANVGTKLTIGTIIPAAVPNSQTAISHTIPVIPGSTCKSPGGTTTLTDYFDIVVTSSLGIATPYHYSFTYPTP